MEALMMVETRRKRGARIRWWKHSGVNKFFTTLFLCGFQHFPMFLPKINSRFIFLLVFIMMMLMMLLWPCYTLLMMLLILCGRQAMIKVTRCCFTFYWFYGKWSDFLYTVRNIFSICDDLAVVRDFILYAESFYFIFNCFWILIILNLCFIRVILYSSYSFETFMFKLLVGYFD